MELHIKTTGMCLIVPELNNGAVQRYHLLLPETRHHHPHAAILTYDGAGSGFDLQCRLLDLMGISADRGMANLSNVIDVGALVGNPVPARQVGNRPDPSVSARITIPPPTWTIPGEIAPWQPHRHNGTALPVFPSTHHMTWVYENFDPTTLVLLRQQLQACGSNDPSPLPNPVPDGDVFCISIIHLPPPGTTVGVGQPSPHFHMYGQVYDPPQAPAMKLKRKMANDPDLFMCENTLAPFVEIKSETAYNCMLAKSDLG